MTVAGVAGPLTMLLPSGTRVEVCNRFCRSWGGGFEIVDATVDGYRLRRCSDRYELPGRFAPEDIRRAL